MRRREVFNLLFRFVRQALIGHHHIGEQRVTADRRQLTARKIELSDGLRAVTSECQRFSEPRDFGPCAMRSTSDLADLLVLPDEFPNRRTERQTQYAPLGSNFGCGKIPAM